MVSVSLPDLPKGKEFEEYISAVFQSSGYYIERNITKKEVLELDIVATNYKHSPPDIKLLEVKSGNWGFTDLFKIRGWMSYLNISKGVFIVSNERGDVDFSKQIAKELNIDLVIISDLSEFKEALTGFLSNENIENTDISTWRYSYWVERILLNRLNHKKKSHQDKKCFKSLEDYYFDVNNKIFFIENIVEKVDKLYFTYQKFPRISAKCANELIGNNFDCEYDGLPEQIYRETFYECNYNDIQISTFIEHRARLAILKNAIDCKLYKNIGDKSKTDEWSLALLPHSFKEGLNIISKHKYFNKYPVFWQWFMWIFGGFIIKDHEEREYEILSQKTGVPIGEIANALESYQILFPLNDGWFMDLPNSNIKVMKFFPVPFMGIGTRYRRLLYTEYRELRDFELIGMHTLHDLIKWNNLAVDVLKNG